MHIGCLLGVAIALMEAESMPVSQHLRPLEKGNRVHKKLLQDSQDGLSSECKSIVIIFNGPFSVDVMVFKFFFICSETENQRCLCSVSEKDI